VNSYEEFKKVLDEKTGFVYAHWDGTPETEEKIKEETKATIRCIPLIMCKKLVFAYIAVNQAHNVYYLQEHIKNKLLNYIRIIKWQL